LLSGFVATLLLTTILAGSQQVRLSRMSIPYLLGSLFTAGRERAKIVGFFVHLVNGQVFALVYVALFHAWGAAGPWRGAGARDRARRRRPARHRAALAVAASPDGERAARAVGHAAARAARRARAALRGDHALFVVVGHAAYGLLLGILYKLPGG